MSDCQFETTILSPAKLNLGLRIVGRREDGYHLLESLFWPINLCDEVCVRWNTRFSGVATEWAESIEPAFRSALPAAGKNLVDRALEGVFQGKGPGIEVSIAKKIPIGGGLGGGSSNAGSFLRYLQKLRFIDPDKNMGLASSLGADVPFFLQPFPSWVTGTGEKVQRVHFESADDAKLYFLLLQLPTPSPTQQVYEEYRKDGVFSSTSKFDPEAPWNRARLLSHLMGAKNDLEIAAGRVNPLIPRALTALRQLGAIFSTVAGSGSTCFAVFLDEASRQESAKALQHFCRDNQCRTLNAETFAGG